MKKPAFFRASRDRSSQGVMADRPGSEAALTLYNRTRLCVLAVVVLVLASTLAFPFVDASNVGLTHFLFLRQDLPLMPLVMIFLLVRPTFLGAVTVARRDQLDWRLPAVAAVAVLLLCWAGHRWVFLNWDLSRDEQMADFDGLIYGRGAAVWPIPLGWRPYADALNQMYIQPVGDHEGWVSNYLPVNAAIRALFAKMGLIDLTGPAFAVLGLLCLWNIAKRLWPDDGHAPLIAALFYLGSSQILVTGMTAYAMNAYVGLNLLWLSLFLRGGRAGHGGAILVGLFATGIHQPLFHPLFVLPFFDLLRRERRWRTLIAYGLGYMAIGAVWAVWPLWISSHGVGPIPADAAPVGVGYIDRVLTVIGLRPRSVVLMAMNLIRFATWQHLLLLPLMVMGVITSWRSNPLMRSLAIGIVLPLLAVTVLTPYQGYGWGYRYLHGVIGSACILATGGYVWLRSRGFDMVRPMAWATGVSLFLLLPVHLVMAHRQVAPFAHYDAQMRAASADVLILDAATTPFSWDLAINRPDLSNRPVRLLGTFLRPAEIGALCRNHVLSFVDAPLLWEIDAMFGLPIPHRATAGQRALEGAARAQGCAIRPFP